MNADSVTNTTLTHEKMMMNVGGLIFSHGGKYNVTYLRTEEKGAFNIPCTDILKVSFMPIKASSHASVAVIQYF